MKGIAVCLLACWAAGHVAAAEPEWLTDLSRARERAKAENKLVLIDFTGSDWCPPCMGLATNVFASTQFLGYAKTNLVLVEVDFPIHKSQSEELKKANRALSSEFDVGGRLPTLILLSADGKQLDKKVGYGGQSAKQVIADLEGARNRH